jgi:hypothetical protein
MNIGREVLLAALLFLVAPLVTITGGYVLQGYFDARRPAPPPFDPESGDADVHAGGRHVGAIVAGYAVAIIQVVVGAPLVYLCRLAIWVLRRWRLKSQPPLPGSPDP